MAALCSIWCVAIYHGVVGGAHAGSVGVGKDTI